MGCSSSKEARAGKAAKEKHASVGSSTLITDDNQAGNAEKEAMSRGRTNTMNSRYYRVDSHQFLKCQLTEIFRNHRSRRDHSTTTAHSGADPRS